VSAVLIVTYHDISESPSPVTVTPRQLTTDLEALGAAGFTWASLDDCADWLAGTITLQPLAAVVTFDDGYASVASAALPVLQRLRVPATVFVVAGRIGDDNQWPGQWPSIRRAPLLDAGALRELTAAGVALGCHSLTHPRLTELDAAAAATEITEAADRLEHLVQVAVRHFAYPYGVRGSREMAAARRRYRTAVSASCGLVDRDCDPLDLPRFDAHDLRVAMRLGLLKTRWLGPYAGARRLARRARLALTGPGDR
jgi:peptidoglycan/xylan/chitin deacetylase (PgdA/CDA1 family)